MANQKIDVVGDKDQRVAYCGADGQKLAVYDKGQEPVVPPPGTVYVQEVTLVMNALVDGKPAKGFLGVEGPKTFLRGRVVTGYEAWGYAPITIMVVGEFLKEIDPMAFRREVIDTLRCVVTRDRSGSEEATLVNEGDILPPAGASEYAVGESPEELAEADAEGDFDDFDEEEETPAELAREGPTDGQKNS